MVANMPSDNPTRCLKVHFRHVNMCCTYVTVSTKTMGALLLIYTVEHVTLDLFGVLVLTWFQQYYKNITTVSYIKVFLSMPKLIVAVSRCK